MYLRNLWILAALSLQLTHGKLIQGRDQNVDYSRVCKQISKSVSSASHVYYAGNAQYTKDITSWSLTNVERAACTVEPGTSKDVAKILKFLGSTKTPFAVKGGGHSPNPGFSSTKGVLISMRQFSKIKYDAKSKTVVIGAGLIWDDVYEALMAHNVSVLGGRVSGVGVAGFLLGGGYSFKSNEHGLGFDTVTAYKLVTPTGDIIIVSKNSNSELMFGLKGGLNNFGIVTEFTMKTFPQTDVWGGVLVYSQAALPDLRSIIPTFNTQVNDPKASILTTLNFAGNEFVVVQILFYDAPSPPTGMFDKFINIQALQADVSQRSLLSLIQSIPVNATAGRRNLFSTTPILEYTPTLIDAIVNETMFWGQALARKSAVVVSYDIEPFTQAILSHNKTPTAYPADRSVVMSPFNINYVWASAEFDPDFYAAVGQSKATLQSALFLNGQSVANGASAYPNYALFDTPLNQMYGANVKQLKALKKKVDPDNVMGLAGGFKF